MTTANSGVSAGQEEVETAAGALHSTCCGEPAKKRETRLALVASTVQAQSAAAKVLDRGPRNPIAVRLTFSINAFPEPVLRLLLSVFGKR
jgi:hypothetical protein